MKRRFFIWIFALNLFALSVRAEEAKFFPRDPGTWIENKVNGWSVRTVSMTMEIYEELRDCPDSLKVYPCLVPTDTATMKTVRDVQEINRLLPAGAHLITRYNEYEECEEVVEFITGGGMKFIPNAYTAIAEYYPESEYLAFKSRGNNNIWQLIDVQTGEDVLPECTITTSADGSLRFIEKYYYPFDEMGRIIQWFDPSRGQYMDIGALPELTAYDTGEYTTWINKLDRFFWVGNRLYCELFNWYSDNNYLIISFTPEPEGMHPAADVKPSVTPVPSPPPIWYETEVIDPLTIDYGMTDLTTSCNGHRFRYRRIPPVDFAKLLEYYVPRQLRSRIVYLGLDNISAQLPGYTFIRYPQRNILCEIRVADTMRVMMPADQEEEYYAYYPEEDILAFYGGHGSDQSLNIRTGMHEDYNPAVTIYSPDMLYRVTGSHTGQDSYEFRIQKLDTQTAAYRNLAYLYEISAALWGGYGFNWPEDFFWIDHTLYFRSDRQYASITILNE